MEHDKSYFKFEYRVQSGLRATPCGCFKWNGQRGNEMFILCNLRVFLSWNLFLRKC